MMNNNDVTKLAEKARQGNKTAFEKKTELLYLQEFISIEHFISELHVYIDWYNTKRIKLKLNGMSPVEYRLNAA